MRVVLREWGRIGVTGFGGPPTHIRLLRSLCVERNDWLTPFEFEDAVATCNLLPGPSSTQLSIFCAYRARGPLGALVGGLAFILPGLVAVILLAALFLAGSPPAWVLGAGAGAGAAVAAVAVQAGWSLLPTSWRRRTSTTRFVVYVTVGALASAFLGAYVVVVLLACGVIELSAGILLRRSGRGRMPVLLPLLVGLPGLAGTWLALTWVAFKVGALSYGGGFVIVPLIREDAVGRFGWMSPEQFLNAVALGQVTPGPVVHTVAVVGYAASGLGGALLATVIAFAPSFVLVLVGARHFPVIRADVRARSFLDGAGPAAIGAIMGVAVPLALSVTVAWQVGVLLAALLLLLALRRQALYVLLLAGAFGVVAALAGAPLPP
jgi:chromate transporter